MRRFTVDRSVIRAEVERRKNAASGPAAPVVPPGPAARRWSARVFVVPAVIAGALARMTARAAHAASPEPQPSPRRRGVYIWRSADAASQPEPPDELLTMPDVSTAELEIAKLRGKKLH